MQWMVLRLCQLYLGVQTLFRLFDAWGLLYSAVCAVLVYFCESLDWAANIPASIFISVLIFPMAFAVNAAYHRREAALSNVRYRVAVRLRALLQE